MISKKNKLNLIYSQHSFRNGLNNKKSFSLFLLFVFLSSCNPLYSNENKNSITLNQSENINQIRKYYYSPVKSLQKLLNQTISTQISLPVYSLVKGKSYVSGKYSETKKESPTKNKKSAVFSWLTNNDYSRFINDPFYVLNKDLKPLNNSASFKKVNYNNFDTSICTIRINNKLAYDFEMILWPNGQISVPIKTLASIVDVDVNQNHVDKSIEFKQPNTGNPVVINYKTNKITVGTNLIQLSEPKLVFVKDGFLVKDDIFVPEQIAKDILDVKMNFVKDSYTFDASTSRVLKAIVQLSESKIDESNKNSDIDNSLTQINTAIKENKIFKIKQLNYNIGSNLNQASSSMDNNTNATGNAGVTMTGNFLGGEFNIGTNTFYGQNSLQVSGYRASLDYLKPNYELSLGATTGNISDLVVPGASIWGLRVGSVGSNSGNSSVPRLIQGKADENSFVELFINDIYADKQLVNDGRFEFDSLNYPSGKTVKIRVEQVGLDGNRKVIYDRKFSQDKYNLAKGQTQFSLFSGVDSTAISNSFSLFGDAFDSSYIQPIKYISGAKFRFGVTDELTMGLNIGYDFILRSPSKLFLNNLRTLSSARTYRTGRSSSGLITSLDMDYSPSKNLHVDSELGLSISKSKTDPYFDANGTDIGGNLGFEYKNNNYSLSGKLFNYGSDFYSPGSSYYSDRRGFEVNSSWKLSKINFYGSATGFQTNLDNYFLGGIAQAFDYNLYASTHADEYTDIRAGIRSSGSNNNIYNDRDTTFDMTINKKLAKEINFSFNYSRSLTKNSTPSTNSNYKNTSDRINADLTYDAGKLGIIKLSHEMLALDPLERVLLAEYEQSLQRQNPTYSKNLRISLERGHLPIKGLTFSPNIGYRYGGDDKGLNCGINLGYLLKNGAQIMVSYAYNASFAKYFTGTVNFGNSKSHSISFNIVDAISFGGSKGMKTNNAFLSPFDSNSGVIRGTVFVDLNQNGKRDSGEPPVPGVIVNFKNLFDIKTDKDGNFIAANVPQGLRKVGINKESLPVIFNPSIADVLVNVKRERVYVANLAVISTPGSISGKILSGDSDIDNQEVVVVLTDNNGKEIKYTTTDSRGGFYLGSIPPGEYKLSVDQNFLDYKGLQLESNQPITINIPMVTDDFVDLTGMNLKLVHKKGNLMQF